VHLLFVGGNLHKKCLSRMDGVSNSIELGQHEGITEKIMEYLKNDNRLLSFGKRLYL
jgi:hypothetical protein